METVKENTDETDAAVRYDFDSSVNQEIKFKFVDINVHISVSSLIEATTDYQDGSILENVENLYAIEHYCDHEDFCHCEEDEDCECECSCEEEQQEIYEWWSVSSYLAKKLKEKGQPILEKFGHTIWGRTCTGQSINHDSLISEICSEMEILEGNKFEWKM